MSGTSIIVDSEAVPEVASFGIRAFTTTRATGSFGVATTEPVRDVMSRWDALRRELRTGGPRFATAAQVHGTRVLVHHGEWQGWLRGDDADGHVAAERGTALAVTVADCVPVFLAHPAGAIALLHSGWRGTATRIVERGIEGLTQRGFPASEIRVHTGPAICGKCYEVSADVYAQLTGTNPGKPTTVDLRALIADHARAAGVIHITTSPSCTRCDNDRFYSHRAGDLGRQLGVMIADA
ncbi:MAG: Multi-copper polyphenol oxidoreductase, laccase [Gemmatimonadetes bacterium]|nr:Multi-copper polyphenol oxidoreductase, laccase [Gemmatimonadota bacterium]